MKIYNLYDTQNAQNIFNYIFNNKGDKLEWLTEDAAKTMNDEYYLLHSGDKNASVLYDRLSVLFTADNPLAKISAIILNKYADNWDRLYAAIYAKYNPIENYNSLEKEKYNTDMNVSNNEDINTFGLGTTSSDGRPMQKTNVDVTTTGDAEKNYRELTRSGNIGVTTSQQMIQSEIDLRRDLYNFYNIIYDDIDSILCNNLY